MHVAGIRFLFFYFPVLLLGPVLASLFFDMSAVHDFKTSIYALGNIAFFNQSHVIISFFLFSSLTPFQKWTKEYSSLGLSFGKKAFLIFAVYFLLHQLAFQPYFKSPTIVLSFYFLVFGVVSAQHALFQSFGFSLLLNGTSDSARSIRYERLAINVVLYSSAAFIFLKVFFRDMWLNVFTPCLVVALMIPTVIMIYSLYKLPANERLLKSIFVLRYYFIILSPFTFWASWATWFYHGFEYVLSAHLVTKNSEEWQSGKLKKPLLTFSAIQIFYILLLVLNLTHPSSQGWIAAPLSIFLSGLTFSTTFLHYYFDSFCYKTATGGAEILKSVNRAMKPFLTSPNPEPAHTSDLLTPNLKADTA